jgi:hypothetical protein
MLWSFEKCGRGETAKDFQMTQEDMVVWSILENMKT